MMLRYEGLISVLLEIISNDFCARVLCDCWCVRAILFGCYGSVYLLLFASPCLIGKSLQNNHRRTPLSG